MTPKARSAAARRGWASRRRLADAQKFGPGGTHRGSDPVDGSIAAILARIRAAPPPD